MESEICLIYVGAGIQKHPSLRPYIERHIARYGLCPTLTLQCKKKERELLHRIEKLLREEKSDLLIFGDDESFSIVDRILDTLDVTVSHNGEMRCISSERVERGKRNTLYRIGERHLNVIAVNPWEKLPPILLKSTAKSVYHLFFEDGNSPAEWQELSSQEETGFETTTILPGWIRPSCTNNSITRVAIARR